MTVNVTDDEGGSREGERGSGSDADGERESAADNATLSPTIASIPVSWVPDHSQNYCYACACEFSSAPSPDNDFFTRIISGGAMRHHCRHCGYIFCHGEPNEAFAFVLSLACNR